MHLMKEHNDSLLRKANDKEGLLFSHVNDTIQLGVLEERTCCDIWTGRSYLIRITLVKLTCFKRSVISQTAAALIHLKLKLSNNASFSNNFVSLPLFLSFAWYLDAAARNDLNFSTVLFPS